MQKSLKKLILDSVRWILSYHMRFLQHFSAALCFCSLVDRQYFMSPPLQMTIHFDFFCCFYSSGFFDLKKLSGFILLDGHISCSLSDEILFGIFFNFCSSRLFCHRNFRFPPWLHISFYKYLINFAQAFSFFL